MQLSQLVASSLGKAEMFQGPPKADSYTAASASGPAGAKGSQASNFSKPVNVAGRGAASSTGGRRDAAGRGAHGQRGSGSQLVQGYPDRRGQRSSQGKGAMQYGQTGPNPAPN